MKFRTLSSANNLTGSRVLLRVDYNVALDDSGSVAPEELFRISRTVPTIQYLLAAGASIVLMTHLGRPHGRLDQKLTTKPLAKELTKMLNMPVQHIPGLVDASTAKHVSKLKPGRVCLLDNLKFNPGEESNSVEFAKQLAELGDILVHDAFASIHRTLASTVALVELMDSYIGLLIEEEVHELSTKVVQASDDFVVVMGGAKTKTKLPCIKHLLSKATYVLTGGILANTLLASAGNNLGLSVVEDLFIKSSKAIVKHKNVVLPRDVICDSVTTNDIEAELRNLDEIEHNDRIIDIGTVTAVEYAQKIREAKTVFFNGPLGFMEKPEGMHGSQAIAELIAALTAQEKITSVIGGGETAALFDKLGLLDDVSYVSTGGGALLSFLVDQKQPGLVPYMV